jgi:hypothetical protein
MKWPLRILNVLFWIIVIAIGKVLLDRAGIGGAIPVVILFLIGMVVMKIADKKIVGKFSPPSNE